MFIVRWHTHKTDVSHVCLINACVTGIRGNILWLIGESAQTRSESHAQGNATAILRNLVEDSLTTSRSCCPRWASYIAAHFCCSKCASISQSPALRSSSHSASGSAVSAAIDVLPLPPRSFSRIQDAQHVAHRYAKYVHSSRKM